MPNPVHEEMYQRHGTKWIFGRRSVGRVIAPQSDQGARPRRRPSKPSGEASAGDSGRSLSKDDVSRLDRLTRGAPQVMVKVVSRTRTATQLQRHVDYISRDGELELETDYGRMVDKEDVAAVRESWIDHIKSQDHVSDHRRAAISVNLMLSMPAGTDRTQFKQAVRDFVEEEFKDRHETLMAFHDDTDKPHAHIAVLSRDAMGKSLNADRDRLDQWREGFAEKLRDRGIEADATPRHARGNYMKAPHLADYHRTKDGDMSKTRFSVFASAYEDVKQGREPEERPWRRNIKTKHEAVKTGYELAAKELSQSPDAKERDIARRLADFAARMDAPETRYDRMRGFVERHGEAADYAMKKYGARGSGHEDRRSPQVEVGRDGSPRAFGPERNQQNQIDISRDR